MTVKDLEKRITALETEVRTLREQVAAGSPKKSIADLFGKYKDDPVAAEADRLGREWRERENRKSVEFDRREIARNKKKTKSGKKTRKSNVGA
jgi:hypothetical protein